LSENESGPPESGGLVALIFRKHRFSRKPGLAKQAAEDALHADVVGGENKRLKLRICR
jgi:hypothetical protein